MRPPDGNVDHGSASRIELIQRATDAACVQLWARVVLQILADIEAGLCILRAAPRVEPARGNDAASSTPTVSAPSMPLLLHEKVKEARTAVAWLFGPAARRDRAGICGWIGVEPEQLQAAVRREHGSALDALLAKR